MAEWWHVIELGDGETSPGAWDLRPLAERIPWPDLHGKRCLDIGTADGFWAFELERRGAAEVTATDEGSPFARRSRRNFDEARERRGSSVRSETCDVYDLEGEWDVAFMGYVLQMVEDPIRALRAVARVAKTLLLLDTVSLPLTLLPSPLPDSTPAATAASGSSSTRAACASSSSSPAGRSRSRPVSSPSGCFRRRSTGNGGAASADGAAPSVLVFEHSSI